MNMAMLITIVFIGFFGAFLLIFTDVYFNPEKYSFVSWYIIHTKDNDQHDYYTIFYKYLFVKHPYNMHFTGYGKDLTSYHTYDDAGNVLKAVLEKSGEQFVEIFEIKRNKKTFREI